MADQYECFTCTKLFPTTEAVDGFQQGYDKGFLCPYCGANLVEAGESDDINHLEYGYTYAALMMFIGWLVQKEIFWFHWVEQPFINGALLILALGSLPTIIFVLINKDALFKQRIIYTRKVLKADK